MSEWTVECPCGQHIAIDVLTDTFICACGIAHDRASVEERCVYPVVPVVPADKALRERIGALVLECTATIPLRDEELRDCVDLVMRLRAEAYQAGVDIRFTRTHVVQPGGCDCRDCGVQRVGAATRDVELARFFDAMAELPQGVRRKDVDVQLTARACREVAGLLRSGIVVGGEHRKEGG